MREAAASREVVTVGRYAEMYARSLNDPDGFWGEAAESIHWEQRWERVLDERRPPSTAGSRAA